MDRTLLFGLSATLDLATAEPNRAGPDHNASPVITAVVELHRPAKWAPRSGSG
jgi:hypothetical protein